MGFKVKKNDALKEVHEAYKKNSGGTLDYIGEMYQVIDGQLQNTFSAGWDTEVSGTAPLTLSDARPKATTWTIDGNTSQNGTPSPSVPIDVLSCGDKTEQLWNPLNKLNASFSGSVGDTGNINRDLSSISYWFPIEDGETYSVYCSATNRYRAALTMEQPAVGVSAYCIHNSTAVRTFTFTNSNNYKYVYVQVTNGVLVAPDVFNAVKGSTAPTSYIPFGYKVPIKRTVNGIDTTYNMTLPASLNKINNTYKDSINSSGVLTRNIGIEVLDGTETWVYDSGRYYHIPESIASCGAVRTLDVLCTHFYPSTVNATGIIFHFNRDVYVYPNMTLYPDVTSFKAWLAEQYANGTPVIIYYPLATETTTQIEVPTITTERGTNYIDCLTEVQPSNMSVTYRKRTE